MKKIVFAVNGMKKCVRLRAMEPEDLDLLYRIENDPEVWHVSATNVPYSRYALHDYMARTTGDIFVDHQVRLMIENEEGIVVGIVDLVDFDAKHSRAELGLIIERPFQRQGYATLVLQQVAHYARTVLRLHQIYACISINNEASLALFRKLQFAESAVMKDWLFDGHTFVDAVLMQKIL